MIIVTTIDVPDYVYLFFQKEAEPWRNKTPEDMMAGYLARHVRRTMESRARKEEKAKQEIKVLWKSTALFHFKSRTTSLATL